MAAVKRKKKKKLSVIFFSCWGRKKKILKSGRRRRKNWSTVKLSVQFGGKRKVHWRFFFKKKRKFQFSRRPFFFFSWASWRPYRVFSWPFTTCYYTGKIRARDDDDDDDKSNCLQLSTCVSSPIFHAFELRDKELPPHLLPKKNICPIIPSLTPKDARNFFVRVCSIITRETQQQQQQQQLVKK
jgi:hypothetical protein